MDISISVNTLLEISIFLLIIFPITFVVLLSVFRNGHDMDAWRKRTGPAGQPLYSSLELWGSDRMMIRPDNIRKKGQHGPIRHRR